jgi:hypothetical protein
MQYLPFEIQLYADDSNKTLIIQVTTLSLSLSISISLSSLPCYLFVLRAHVSFGCV